MASTQLSISLTHSRHLSFICSSKNKCIACRTLKVGLPRLHVYYDHSLKTFFTTYVFPTLIRMLQGLYKVLIRPDL